MFGYIIILPIITNVQKILLHTGAGCLATRQKKANFARSSSLKQLPCQPDIKKLPEFML